MVAFPKPRPKAKKRKSLRRGKSLSPATYAEAVEAMRRLRARRKKHPLRLTAHARRERAWGFMAFQRSQPCDVVAAHAEEFGVDPIVDAPWALGACRGAVQFMHLPLTVGRRRGPDMDGAPGCGDPGGHHRGIDGGVGGKAKWYVALGWEGQQRLRSRLRARALARWEALTPAERDRWDEKAATKRKGRTPWT